MTQFLEFAAAAVALAGASTGIDCGVGLYQSPDGAQQVALSQTSSGWLRYTLKDGRRGSIGEASSPFKCDGGSIRSEDGVWRTVPLRLTEGRFRSHGQQLSGVLIEPPTPGPHPLVVLVHGSEKTSSRRFNPNPYIFAAYGLSVFAYDKRGTGESEGEYTQNFELLADDAAAAMAEARRLAADRVTRAGFFGGSQGGWIAPLAATRASADFVAIGYGLIASPIEEDRSQVLSEMRERGYGPADQTQAGEVADAAGRLVASHFASGYHELAEIKQRYKTRPWFGQLKGEFTGDIIRENETDLRRVGRALYDNLELIWDYDAPAVIRQMKSPQLWILAEKDREAPPEITLERLVKLRSDGVDLTIYSFPDTDHGMYEFAQAPDGSRTATRVTDGYFRLLTDWIKGQVGGPYGRARRR